VGQALKAEMILPEAGGVANAIGAVVGRVTLRREGVVTSPGEGRFRVHLPQGPEDFADQEAALACLEAALRAEAEAEVSAAGASEITATVTRDIRVAQAENREMFLEATVRVEVSGRPRIAG
jgi:hypothetical protein